MPEPAEPDLLPSLTRRGADLIQQWETAAAADRVTILGQLAETLIEVRECFTDPEGRGPDLLGKTYAYRTTIADMYRQAGVDKKTSQQISRNVKFHADKVRHKRMTTDQMVRYGITPETQSERKSDHYQWQRAQTDTEDPAGQIKRLVGILDRVKLSALEEASDETRGKVKDTLSELASLASERREEIDELY